MKDALILDLNPSDQSIIHFFFFFFFFPHHFKVSFMILSALITDLREPIIENGLLWWTMQRDPHCYNVEISFKYWIGKRINFHFHWKHDRAIASQGQMSCELHLDCISLFLPRLPKLPVPAHLNNICWAIWEIWTSIKKYSHKYTTEPCHSSNIKFVRIFKV